MVLLGKIMILQGVGHPISCLGVCYANDPKKGGYMTPAPALDLTTSLRGDFVTNLKGEVFPREVVPYEFPLPTATHTPPPMPPRAERMERAGEETGQGERGEPRRVTGQGRPRSPNTVQSAEGEEGKEKRERIIVGVRSPCQENYPADAHPSALKSVLESANPRMDSECASGCTWSTARATARLRDGRPPE